ncbi:MarR family winged helix-turn-helix transcriptional regulator [Streptomyces sp. NPDC059718]
MTDRHPATATRQPPPILWSLGLLHGELRATHGLSLHDYLILGALAEAEGRPVPLTRLSALLRETRTRIASLLTGLEAAGLVERSRGTGDRRTIEVTLTEAGRARFTDAERAAHERLRRHFVL